MGLFLFQYTVVDRLTGAEVAILGRRVGRAGRAAQLLATLLIRRATPLAEGRIYNHLAAVLG
ncbi:MAG: hypothetical protein UY66_C0037G0006 [Parcubacteria group bacterium GW2011_GWC1_51_35]|nr:MAG: hypothetical protein UY66_C0037G0006 [Parcubacteria group bacterium GW2011_GWC1_51_35]